jgi:hypothetical protein
MTDGQMIARMARENTARRKFDMAVLREAIAAGVQAHGAGKILPSEMPVEEPTYLRVSTNESVSDKIESARTVGCRFEILP